MSRLDRLIEEALDAEDRAIFASQGEQGFFGQVGGLFAGPLGWMSALTMIVQIAMFAGALYAARQFLVVDDAAAMLRWGALAGLLMAAMSVIKLMHWSQMQANRAIREIKRVELMLARSKAV